MVKSKRSGRRRRGNKNISTRSGGSKDNSASSPKKSLSPQTDYDDAELFSDCHGNIFVCDTGNNRIQVIRYRV